MNLRRARGSEELARLERVHVAIGTGTQAANSIGKIVLIEVGHTYAAMHLFPKIFGPFRGIQTYGVLDVHLQQSLV